MKRKKFYFLVNQTKFLYLSTERTVNEKLSCKKNPAEAGDLFKHKGLY